MEIHGQIVDIASRRIFPGVIRIEDGKIRTITELEAAPTRYILPGFVDAHVHVESSMLVPTEFARLAVLHGTVATVSDPHEIANVLGVDGVEFMIQNGNATPFKFYFGAPSCVPATAFETAGAEISDMDIAYLFDKWDLNYLSEMMNYPGVLFNDPIVVDKLRVARARGKPIDGHAPGLSGEQAVAYIGAGISTDHECFTYDEAKWKLDHGMKVIIREGSAAKNFEALHPLISDYSDRLMFCSDDKHPDDLVEGHINDLVARAVGQGHDLFSVLQMACVNPVVHYRLDVGQLQLGDPADFIAVNDLTHFRVLQTFIDGQLCADNGQSSLPRIEVTQPNQFKASELSVSDIAVEVRGTQMRVIKAIDGELITGEIIHSISKSDAHVEGDVDRDILKLVVFNRYAAAKPAMAFIHGFALKKGAIASTVAHDSHNIIAVGVDDAAIVKAISALIANRGGVVAVDSEEVHVLPLPIAGLMSDQDGYTVGQAYGVIDDFVKTKLGSTLRAPFMTLSFMALPVIPKLKLTDLGLFDGETFQHVDLFV